MRRFILWIAALLITFVAGTVSNSVVRHLRNAPPAPVAVAKTESVPALAAPTPTPHALILDYDLEKYARYGTLYVMGPAPEGFSDFDSIDLSLGYGGHGDYPGAITVFSIDGYDSASANFAFVTERILYFVTEPGKKQGFEYRFEGEFLVKDFEAIAGKQQAAVRGTLTKFKDGRNIAEQTLTFRIENNSGC